MSGNALMARWPLTVFRTEEWNVRPARMVLTPKKLVDMLEVEVMKGMTEV